MTEATATEVPRDRWGKPLINRDGKLVAYNRASSFGDVLDDRSNLEKWKTRMAVHGLARRPDLYLKATALPLENRSALNKLSEEAIEAAGGSVASNTGTALHALTEQIDRGEAVGPIPAEYADLLEQYRVGTERFEMYAIERFMVCDELEVAGTPDRLIKDMNECDLDNGIPAKWPLCVGDLKTGSSSGFLDKHAVQLAIYAHSDFYDPATGEREAVDVAKDYGYIFHLPIAGQFGLYKLDLEAGWEGALLAADVRKWRKRKGICVPA